MSSTPRAPFNGGGTTTAGTTTSTAATALGKGGGRYSFTSLGAHTFVRFGDSSVGAAATTTGAYDLVVPSGTEREITIPNSTTHFRQITDTGTSAVYWGKVGN